jgi:hypothetical protein
MPHAEGGGAVPRKPQVRTRISGDGILKWSPEPKFLEILAVMSDRHRVLTANSYFAPSSNCNGS